MAVEHSGGPLLIHAGAGSGKTRVISHRIAYLIDRRGVAPDRILAVTFTNKAAAEMRARVVELLGPFTAARVGLGTFHAACVRILRRFPEAAGLQPNFSIYDAADQLRLVHECLQELTGDASPPDAREMHARISHAKQYLLTPALLQPDVSPGTLDARFVQAYSEYEHRLGRANGVDFDDLLLKVVSLFRAHPAILALYRDAWQHVLVDEYQDTNRAQYQFVSLLAALHRNLCVVGDDDQAIYAWRGADLTNLLEFRRDYPDCRIVHLARNYRSTKRILAAAQALIAHNDHRIGKTLRTDNSDGDRVAFHCAADPQQEARYIAGWIRHLRHGGICGFPDVAVLYRVHAQSRALEAAFRDAQIPYVIVGGTRFVDRREIKDVLAYLRVLRNPEDDQALQRILNVPARGVGMVAIGQLAACAMAESRPLWSVCRDPRALSAVSGRARRGLDTFVRLITDLRTLAETPPVPALIEAVLERSGYAAAAAADPSDEEGSRAEHLREFLAWARGFERDADERTLSAFLDHVDVVTDADPGRGPAGAVTLSTLHAAKGLEFPVVFLSGLEHGLLPHARALAAPAGIEEERRLCYVGMTRAKRRLFLSMSRQRWGSPGAPANEPSCFLREISSEHVVVSGLDHHERPFQLLRVGHRG